MLLLAVLLLLLACNASSMPVKEPARPVVQAHLQQKRPSYLSQSREYRDGAKNREAQRLSVLRRKQLGKPIRQRLAKEDRLRNLPDHMRGMTRYERAKERKRMLGFRPGDRIPHIWKSTLNEVLMRAEKKRQKDSTLDLAASIQETLEYSAKMRLKDSVTL
jgi:hypothetical protein